MAVTEVWYLLIDHKTNAIGYPFAVDAPHDAKVMSLLEKIQAKASRVLADVYIAALSVWKLRDPPTVKSVSRAKDLERFLNTISQHLLHDEESDSMTENETPARWLSNADRISELGDWPENKLHILVQLPGIELGSERPSLTGPATSKKRELLEDRIEVNKRIRHDFAAGPLQTPSMIAVPSNYQRHYQMGKQPRIRCGRPDENQNSFPLVLAHLIFASFVSQCETYEPEDEDLMFISNLSHCMCQFFEDEKDRRTQFRTYMREYGINLTEAKIEGTEFTTDGDARVGALPYLISEAGRDFGAIKGDPYIQTAAYHLAATQKWLKACPNDRRALPCIHIFYNGPVLGFAGSMLTEEFDVNVLGPILPLFYHRTDINSQIRCAKMFGPLKNSATALREYYEDTTPESFADTRFPWITQYDTTTTPTENCKYEYLSQMDGGNLLYICKHIHDQKQILVKFIRTYSKDAHLASAAKGGAPMLLGHHDILSCGWSVVVMQLLEEPEWVLGLKIIDKTEQRMVRDKVKEHVLALHQQGFVHSDIRPQNVLVKRSDTGNGPILSVRLVDFDWAGETNKAK